jgi:tetratricopeptide (TPR) repeat protein
VCCNGFRRRRAITLDDREFVGLAAAWVAAADPSTLDRGLARDEVVREAREFLVSLRKGRIVASTVKLDNARIDVLHASCCILSAADGMTSKEVLLVAQGLYGFVADANWPHPDFEERAEVLCACAFSAWRAARQSGNPGEAAVWFRRLVDAMQASAVAFPVMQSLSASFAMSSENVEELEDSETLLELCAFLKEQIDSSPSTILKQAPVLYQLLQESKTVAGQFDEREYFVGEFALLAGIACRQLSRRQEARSWFDRAEKAFQHTVNEVVELLRVGYQRLSLRIEERQNDVILEFAPALGRSLEKSNMDEEALKCRFLEVVALGETGRIAEAFDLAEDVCRGAKKLGNQRLLGLAYCNLALYAGLLGDSSGMLEALGKAIPVLTVLNDRIGLAKARWSMGNSLRQQGQIPAAIEAYRFCRQEFESLGMVADVAAMRLAVADLLIESGQEQEATQEILAAVPIIEDLKMVPERLAALSLLRESLRQQKINRQALRDLHGFLEENKK